MLAALAEGEVPRLPARGRAAVRRRRARRSPSWRWRAPPARTTNTLRLRGGGWWVRRRHRRPVARAQAGGDPPASPACSLGARAPTRCPSSSPAPCMFNRLWPLALFTVACGAVGVLHPPGAGDRRRLRAAVALTVAQPVRGGAAIEGRDGVRFLFDRTSPVRRAEAAAPARPAQDRAGRGRAGRLERSAAALAELRQLVPGARVRHVRPS